MVGKIEGRRKGGWQRMRWLGGQHHWVDGHEFEPDTTKRLNNEHLSFKFTVTVSTVVDSLTVTWDHSLTLIRLHGSLTFKYYDSFKAWNLHTHGSHRMKPHLNIYVYIFIYLVVPIQHAKSFFSPVTACGILVSWPGIELWSLALWVWCLNHWTTREVPMKSHLLN